MKQLGTVFANEEQLQRMDKAARKQEIARKEKGKELFSNLERREEGGEIRYYKTETEYAIIGRAGRPLWFHKVNGEWFAK